MIAATVLTVLFVPVFFVMVQGINERVAGQARPPVQSKNPPADLHTAEEL